MIAFFVIVFGLSLSLAQSQEGADTAGFTYEENYFGIPEDLLEIQRWAESFDTARYHARRRSAPGDFISRFGTIADVGCFQGLSDNLQEQNLDVFEQDLGQTFRKIKACYENYPMFEGLLKDVVTILRRTVVTCRSRQSDPTFRQGSDAYSIPLHDLATPARQGRNISEPASARHLYYLVIPDNLRAFNSSESQQARLLTYFHESLHFTGANNLEDHSFLQPLFNSEQPCRKNRYDDRIVFIQTVCGFNNRIGDRGELLDRMNRCGLRRACGIPLLYTDPLDWQLSLFHPNFYGNPFTERDAEHLCQKIHDNLAAERQVQANLSAAQQRIGNVINAITHEGRAMMRQNPRLYTKTTLDKPQGNTGVFNLEAPPYYLAALSLEERALISSASNFSESLEFCRIRADGMVSPASQPEGCPLSNRQSLQ